MLLSLLLLLAALARGTTEVSSSIVEVQQGASETGAASSHVLDVARSLTADSHRLKEQVGKFLTMVRAA